jgi:hypothetical protein
MELVPFHDNWTGSETKLDLKAIYRRKGAGINLTSPLPLRRHKSWAAKGLEYVSLATMHDLSLVAGDLRAMGHDPLPMRSSFDREGHFDTAQYIKQAQREDATFIAELQAKVDKFGVDTVTEMMRMNDHGFVMPDAIKAPEPVETGAKGKAK